MTGNTSQGVAGPSTGFHCSTRSSRQLTTAVMPFFSNTAVQAAPSPVRSTVAATARERCCSRLRTVEAFSGVPNMVLLLSVQASTFAMGVSSPRLSLPSVPSAKPGIRSKFK